MKKVKIRSFRKLSPQIIFVILNDWYVLNYGKWFFRFIIEKKPEFCKSNKYNPTTYMIMQIKPSTIKNIKNFNREFIVKMMYGYFYNHKLQHVYRIFKSIKISEKISKSCLKIINSIPIYIVESVGNRGTGFTTLDVFTLPKKLNYLNIKKSVDNFVDDNPIIFKVENLEVEWFMHDNYDIGSNFPPNLLNKKVQIKNFWISCDFFKALKSLKYEEITLIDCEMMWNEFYDEEKEFIKKEFKEFFKEFYTKKDKLNFCIDKIKFVRFLVVY